MDGISEYFFDNYAVYFDCDKIPNDLRLVDTSNLEFYDVKNFTVIESSYDYEATIGGVSCIVKRGKKCIPISGTYHLFRIKLTPHIKIYNLNNINDYDKYTISLASLSKIVYKNFNLISVSNVKCNLLLYTNHGMFGFIDVFKPEIIVNNINDLPKFYELCVKNKKIPKYEYTISCYASDSIEFKKVIEYDSSIKNDVTDDCKTQFMQIYKFIKNDSEKLKIINYFEALVSENYVKIIYNIDKQLTSAHNKIYNKEKKKSFVENIYRLI